MLRHFSERVKPIYNFKSNPVGATGGLQSPKLRSKAYKMSTDQGGQVPSERSDCFGTVEDEDV